MDGVIWKSRGNQKEYRKATRPLLFVLKGLKMPTVPVVSLRADQQYNRVLREENPWNIVQFPAGLLFELRSISPGLIESGLPGFGRWERSRQ